MKDGAVLANAGHFDVEIDLARAARAAADGPPRDVLPLVTQFDARRAAASTCSPRAAWSTSPPARAIPPR